MFYLAHSKYRPLFRCPRYFVSKLLFFKAVVQVWNCNFHGDENRNSELCEMNAKRGKRQARSEIPAVQKMSSARLTACTFEQNRLLLLVFFFFCSPFRNKFADSRKTNEDETRARYISRYFATYFKYVALRESIGRSKTFHFYESARKHRIHVVLNLKTRDIIRVVPDHWNSLISMKASVIFTSSWFRNL